LSAASFLPVATSELKEITSARSIESSLIFEFGLESDINSSAIACKVASKK
jgi:hypothetical protein